METLKKLIQPEIDKLLADKNYEGSEAQIQRETEILNFLKSEYGFDYEQDPTDEQHSYILKAHQHEIWQYYLDVIMPPVIERNKRNSHYFLVGEEDICFDVRENYKDAITRIKEGEECKTVIFIAGVHDPGTLIEETQGYGAYTEITEEEFNEISAIVEENDKKVELKLPDYLACYLINVDTDGLTESEIIEIDEFLKDRNLSIVGKDEDTSFRTYNDLNNMGADCSTYHARRN